MSSPFPFSVTTILKRLLPLWPPFAASGIAPVHVNLDPSGGEVKVKLQQTLWNRTYYNVHFGGSLYAMSDPFYVFILSHHLGKDHIIWDLAANIRFRKATKETVYATFRVSADEIRAIREGALQNYKVEPEFEADIVTPDGEVVASVWKKLYVRRKDAKDRFPRPISSPDT
mmetsp:Transcript_17130/g.48248  ORF Transcript_17130/g.48248 Transcript_17130/m.48248 type:complete len:171 (+) Transcript_17130:33-545(+)|eukprot:CAMPEP_0119122254 /NCGR_PEP_ID=MMETSP1310-20130426/2569_1 /TAXON_ID=464262 /ORGANISM="Genus nov. species nov., Strain RCC2339" /LENGTH=170 /DNA_ID=CAMNT_0007111881 /DNA_START=33 /DNA_END=545 /DNA_ORIENTATION=-